MNDPHSPSSDREDMARETQISRSGRGGPNSGASEPSEGPVAPKVAVKGVRFRFVRVCLQILGAVFVFLAVLAGAAGGGFWWWANRDLRAAGTQRSIALDVRQGDSLRTVAGRLEAAGVAGPRRLMVALAVLKRADRGLQTGRFLFAEGTPPVVVLEQLLESPKAPTARVTFPEGWTVEQMAGRLKEKGVVKSDEVFLALCRDKDFLSSLGISAPGAEGYLFPDTYFLIPGTDEGEIIRRLVSRFNTIVFSRSELGLLPGINSPDAFPLTFSESVVLASIIEREAREKDEMGTIASVYHNRLRRGMRMDSCATVRFALGKWNAPLTLEDLKTDSPYNTYARKGLPPAPICNPGREALDAAFRPAKSDFLYYVYKGDGKHFFSRTLAEHERASRKYKDAWTFSGAK